MAHPIPNNIFNLNDPKYVILDHIIRHIDINNELISIEPYYQHGVPGVPLFGAGDPQFFVYL